MIFLKKIVCANLLLIVGMLAACESQQTRPENSKTSDSDTSSQNIIHQDSTVYFANRTASVSLRASFISQPASIYQTLNTGYKIQLRSIQRRNISISQVSIIAGGRKIELSKKSFLLPPNKAIILDINLDDTLFIQQQADAVLQFKYDGKSQLMSLKEHQLSQFSPL